MTLPKTLRNFSLYVDGTGYAGRVTELTLPTLTIQTEEYRAGGLDAPIAIDMGMEALEAEFTIAEYNKAIIRRFGLLDQDGVKLKARGAMQRNGEAAESIVVTMNGSITSFDPGSFEAGAITEANFTFACRDYKLEIGNATLIDIDIKNMKRIIDGTDQLESLRTAMGI